MLEEHRRFVDGHLEHIRDALAAELHLERLAVVATPLADLAGHVDVREEVHLDLDHAVARACLAASARHVEGEAARFVPADLRPGSLANRSRISVNTPTYVAGLLRG